MSSVLLLQQINRNNKIMEKIPTLKSLYCIYDYRELPLTPQSCDAKMYIL